MLLVWPFVETTEVVSRRMFFSFFHNVRRLLTCVWERASVMPFFTFFQRTNERTSERASVREQAVVGRMIMRAWRRWRFFRTFIVFLRCSFLIFFICLETVRNFKHNLLHQWSSIDSDSESCCPRPIPIFGYLSVIPTPLASGGSNELLRRNEWKIYMERLTHFVY